MMNAFWLATVSTVVWNTDIVSPVHWRPTSAISYVSRSLGESRKTILSSLLYTLGRVLAYTALGAMVVASLLSAPGLAVWLQKYLNLFLGPILILVGMVLLGLIELPMSSGQGMQKLREKFEKLGMVGAGLLGLLFALSFCPVSAALFFGSLIPLAVKNDSIIFLPALYGIGTGVPVLVFALLLVFGSSRSRPSSRRLRALKHGCAESPAAAFWQWASTSLSSRST